MSLYYRCFRTVYNVEDIDHLTGKDKTKESEHQLFSLFNTSYNGTNSNEHTAAKDRMRKRSIFEMNEDHAIQRKEPGYVDIDIPIDIPSSDEEEVKRRAKQTKSERQSNSIIQIESGAKSGESTYNHITIYNDEGVYNRLTLKNPATNATQRSRSAIEGAEYNNSAVVKSYKTFEDSYSRLSSVVPRKNPFLRLAEEPGENVGTSAQWMIDKEVSDATKISSLALDVNEKQRTGQRKHSYGYSTVNKSFTTERKPETKEGKSKVMEYERNETKISKTEKENCSDSIKTFEVSADCSKSKDKYGYSIVNKHKCLIQPNGKEENEKETKAAEGTNNVTPSRKDEYTEVIKIPEKMCGDFPNDGIEIHSEKFFIVTDN